jgi:hypothetical protein
MTRIMLTGKGFNRYATILFRAITAYSGFQLTAGKIRIKGNVYLTGATAGMLGITETGDGHKEKHRKNTGCKNGPYGR